MRRARGFTLLELMLAMLLAGFILIAAMAIFGAINRTERSLADRFDDVQAMAQAHATLRRAMQTMVAGLPPPPEPPRGVNPNQPPGAEGEQLGAVDEAAAQDDPAAEGSGRESERAGSRSSSRRRGDSAADKRAEKAALARDNDRRAAERARAGEDGEDSLGEAGSGVENDFDGDGRPDFFTPHFFLGPTDPEVLGSVEESAPWTLELVLSQQPLKTLPPSDEPIRGAFEKVRAYDGWALLWRPIDPPGEPVLVIDHLAEVFMAVLPREGAWTDIFEAREIKEYPRAVRVVLFANSGASSDWLFEPGVTLGGEAP